MVKPSFFVDEGLVTLKPLTRLLFIGLWTLADREGRLEDRPERIKMQVFPCDKCNVNAMLDELVGIGVIERYEVGGHKLIQVVNFSIHQHPHHREPQSTLPSRGGDSESPRPALGQPEASPRPALGQPVGVGIRNTEYGIKSSATLPRCLTSSSDNILWLSSDDSEHDSPAKAIFHAVEQEQQTLISDTQYRALVASITDTCPRTCEGGKEAVGECVEVLLRAVAKSHGKPSPLFRKIADEDRRHIR